MDVRPGAPPSRGVFGPADIRDANRTTVYDLVRASGRISRADLVTRSGLARPTVVAIVQDLMATGLVVEHAGRSTPRGGRPPSDLSVDTRAHTVAAARLKGREVEVVLADSTGVELGRTVSRRPPESASWRELVRSVVGHVDAIRSGQSVPTLSSLAIALPGSIDRAGRWSLVKKAAWRDIPIADALSSGLQVPVAAINIAAATLLGHLTHRPTPSGSSVVVYVGRGVGAAFTVDGRLVDGATGSAGELGHCRVPGVTERCTCGRRGCVEAVTRLPHLAREYTRITGEPAPSTVGAMERHPSPEVRSLLATAADQLGLATSWLVDLVNPDEVLLGGDNMIDAPRFLAAFASSVRSHGHPPNVRSLHVTTVTPDSTVTGTVRLATELLPALVAPRVRLVRSAAERR